MACKDSLSTPYRTDRDYAMKKPPDAVKTSRGRRIDGLSITSWTDYVWGQRDYPLIRGRWTQILGPVNLMSALLAPTRSEYARISAARGGRKTENQPADLLKFCRADPEFTQKPTKSPAEAGQGFFGCRCLGQSVTRATAAPSSMKRTMKLSIGREHQSFHRDIRGGWRRSRY